MIQLTIAETTMGEVVSLATHILGRRRNLQAGRYELLRQLGRELAQDVRAEAPTSTGLFAAGIKMESSPGSDLGGSGQTTVDVVSTGEHAMVGNDLPLWKLLYKGTKAHPIPRGGSAAQLNKGYPLSFFWSNGPYGPALYHYWSVQHPGTKPNRFLDRALDIWRPGVSRRLHEFGLQVVRSKGYSW